MSHQEQLLRISAHLKDSVEFAKKNGTFQEDKSWGDQEGVLISYADAQALLDLIESPPLTSTRQVKKEMSLRDYYLGQVICGILSNSELSSADPNSITDNSIRIADLLVKKLG